MTEPQIVPHKITKPIQLLAAWLAGLAVINGSFLAGAGTIGSPEWIPALLAIAAVANVPLFILSLFLLQTKFRPEMQEDTFYSKYLEKKYTSTPTPQPPADLDKQFKNLADRIVSKLSDGTEDREKQVAEILKESEILQLVARFSNSRSLSELHMHHEKWHELVESWEGDDSFENDLTSLLLAGLVVMRGDDKTSAQLTDLGYEIAIRLEKEEKLWNKSHKRRIKKTRTQRQANKPLNSDG